MTQSQVCWQVEKKGLEGRLGLASMTAMQLRASKQECRLGKSKNI